MGTLGIAVLFFLSFTVCMGTEIFFSNGTGVNISCYWHVKTSHIPSNPFDTFVVPVSSNKTFLSTCDPIPPSPNVTYQGNVVLIYGLNGWFVFPNISHILGIGLIFAVIK